MWCNYPANKLYKNNIDEQDKWYGQLSWASKLFYNLYMNHNMKFQTMWYVWPENAQTSLITAFV